MTMVLCTMKVTGDNILVVLGEIPYIEMIFIALKQILGWGFWDSPFEGVAASDDEFIGFLDGKALY
mgnify:FL=1